MNITLRQLKVFERVARRLSFTRAAEELYLTQPAVSMQIKQFEESIGLPLFERLGKKIFLTRAGEELYRLSRQISLQLDEAEQLIEELKGMEGGRLVVAVASTVHYFAIRLLADFCKRYPKVRVNFKVTNRKGLLQMLDDNEVDTVLMGRPPDDMDLVAEAFMDNPLVIIAPTDHPRVGEKGIRLEDLRNETFLMREQGSGTRNAVERFFAERGVRVLASMEMNTNGAIKQGVEVGLGLGLVSIHTVERELADRRVVVLDVEAFPIMRQWYIVHRAGKRLSATATAFEEFVRSEARRFVAPFNAILGAGKEAVVGAMEY
ncbi:MULTISPECIES: LysR family transcriptional regulator [Methylococcus]|jgi:DNA-binding transcriptional LysR family regulator|uniref:Rubisco operon transcriptional regulator n=2 Tax=Methylococcus capsulatus TaxID=414 RepID=Q602M4_METCA|nr:LysR family transcriptional regulator [Methylococcus capsulatus]AAU90902.1 rubisco operon transcriptional regulator [Methylococcus capsulatus str. Bath]QXP89231.1 LysR family transcriptional regulator [Methylococcus capsulatus]CAI8794871.1 RuBisCO operon transcriptional regulator [Methylococcus capsulatus]